MTILVRSESVYGRELLYPACERSRLIAEWLERKTLTTRDIDFLKRLGFCVVRVSGENVKKNWMR